MAAGIGARTPGASRARSAVEKLTHEKTTAGYGKSRESSRMGALWGYREDYGNGTDKSLGKSGKIIEKK
jgi:hypothetical protein